MSTVEITPAATPAGHLRAGDADRDRTTEVLGQALASGHLTMAEFQDRTDRALAAHTLGDLAALVADLPVSPLQPIRPRPDRAARARIGVRIHLAAYLFFVTTAVAIWVVTSAVFGASYFWPIWPALGGGIGLLSHALPVRFGCRPSDRAALGGCGRRRYGR